MNKLLSEIIKVDRALEPETGQAADTDTDFFSLGRDRKALFVIDYVSEGTEQVTVLQGTEEITIGLFEAEDSDGTNSQEIEDADGNDIEMDVAGGVGAVVGILGTDGTVDGDTVTINGVVFTHDDADPFDPADPWLNPLNYDSRDNLILAINNYFTDIVASAGTDGDDIDLEAVDRGNRGITLEEDIAAGTGYVGTIRATFTVEIDASALSDGFTAVGLNIDNTAPVADADLFAVCIRGNSRYNPPYQCVAGSIAI